MLRPRIIPCLLVKDGGLVKTVGFDDPKYVGDPINAVRIFNEKEVDEIIVLDIDATADSREPDYAMIENLAAECRMPLCYGGGVKSVDQAKKIISMGVEKVALSAAAVEDPQIVTRLAEVIGRQSVVVVLDVRKAGLMRKHEICTRNGTRRSGRSPAEFAREMEDLGAGEIVVNSIDQDGAMTGYDHRLIAEVRDAVSLPMTALGGAGSLDDLRELIARHGVIGAAAGSLFVFKGKYRAVLINYPDRDEKDAIATATG
ncbi:MAG: AglZ/HisF2 family acetamidino modification protein [Gammaproteobacteria bacterium]